jgi:hypothetical protein
MPDQGIDAEALAVLASLTGVGVLSKFFCSENLAVFALLQQQFKNLSQFWHR